MNSQSSPPEKTIPTAAAEAMQQPVSAETKGCIFYKLIGKSIIQQKELAIPKKFGRKIGDKLSDVVTLIDCNLTKSKIGLRSHNHRLWFHHGWPKFVEDHSIHAGSFLIFKYEGNSNFAVNIYELVESEMKSSFDNADPSSEPAQPEQIEVDADELIETHPNSKWKRGLISEPDGCLNKKKPRMDVHDKKASFLKWKRRTRAVTDEERRCAVLAAKHFKSGLPFCQIMMGVSYVYHTFDLIFPSEFSNKYLKHIQGVIQLQDPNGRKWPVRCSNKGKTTRLNSAWRGFVLEHNLDEGDVCIFELVQRDDILLKVYIFRAANPEVVQASSESMHKSTPPMVVDDQEVNSAQHSGIGTEDYTNDFMEILNEDIDINVPVPQYLVPGCSKDNNGFAECMAEKTPSSIADSVGWIPFEKTNDTEDYANDFMEKLNKDIDAETSIRVDAQHEAKNFNTGPISEPAQPEQIEATLISSPQSKDIYQTVMLPSPSKTPTSKPFVEFRAEKTSLLLSSVTADSIVRPVLEMSDKPAPGIGTRVDSDDELIETQPNSEWKRILISELGVVDDIPLERRELEVNPAHHSGIGTEDHANDFMDVLNEDININVPVPQYFVPSCSKDKNGFAECMAEKTPSNIAEMRDQPVQEIGIKGNADHLIESRKEINNVYLANQPKLPNDIWKRRLISELGDCCNKKKVEMEAHNKASSLKWKTMPRTVTDEEKRQAVHAAANFTSHFPFCRIVMRSSYLYSICLFLPEDFSKKYLLGKRGPITLQNSYGRKWPAQCTWYREHSVITTGWRKFVVDNNLDGGDVCIFELVQVENHSVVMKVSIFRAAAIPEEEIVQVSGESVPQQTEEVEQQVNLGQSIAIEDYANMEKLNKDVYAETSIRVDAQQKDHNFSTGPSSEPARAEQIEVTSIRSAQSKDIFQTVMLPSPSKTHKDKPFAEFSAEKTYSVTADSTVRPVLEMRDNPAPRIRTRVDSDKLIETQPNSEWKRRLLSELDACHDKKKPVLEVHDKKASFLNLKRRSRAVTDEERRCAVLAASNFKSDLPFCRIMMRASHVSHRFEFSFPSEFSKKHLKDIQGVIELRDPNGRKWMVRCSYKDYRGNARLTTGWRGFVVDNNLDDGDICIFELVQRDDIVLKVSIFRAAAIPGEEIVRVSGESMRKGTNLMFVDNIASERREQEVNPAQHSGIGAEDYANEFMEIRNEDIDIIVPQYSAPGCSKDNNCFAEFMSEKTPSNIAGSVGLLPFEMRDKPATDGEKRGAVHEENTQDCNTISRSHCISLSKNLEEPEILRRPVWHPSRRPNPKLCPSSDV